MDWMFRSRRTGAITLAQLPNWQLEVWLLGSAVMWLGDPQGRVRGALVVLASASLVLWAGDEVLRGVNPFRRIMGVAVLAWLAIPWSDSADCLSLSRMRNPLRARVKAVAPAQAGADWVFVWGCSSVTAHSAHKLQQVHVGLST
jgi:hypothetical protein